MSETCSDEVCGWVANADLTRRWLSRVWDCGDDWCGCSEAQIESDAGRNGTWRKDLRTEWSGPFYTDHEGSPSSDLNRMAQHLRRHHHDLYERIRWPWD